MSLTDKLEQAKKDIEVLRLKLSIAKAKLRKKGLESEAELLEEIEAIL